ncbi:hypothetical protein ACOIOT_001467 [Cronobacter turicensis]|nr:hypothetical protein [Cronobacter turicensis]MDI7405506.1 hypothetical protein [Cronobacter turicensis]
MGRIELTWDMVLYFFAIWGVVYAFALNQLDYYTEVISTLLHKAILGIGITCWVLQYLFDLYNKSITAKLKAFPKAVEIVKSSWAFSNDILLLLIAFCVGSYISLLALDLLCNSILKFSKKKKNP